MSDCGPSLGAQLRTLRQAKGLSLRDVETKSGKKISNPYLSQLENDKIKKPSPHILQELADIYGVQYEMLMEAAGYLSRAPKTDDMKTLVSVALRNIDDLTPEEGTAVMEYIAFIRSKR